MPEAQQKLGPYTLIKKIGRGAFGVVWLAEKKSAFATTNFALKLPRDEDIDIDVFKQEASIWVQASGHPNVVALIEADAYDDQLVLVSEYVPGGSLATWLKEHGGKAPSTDAACEMIEGILAGLAHLHERHIIHRDLKPDNILLQANTPRLADFGIARLLRSGSYSTNISGTLAYMAPEAFDGKRNEQTDVWSVGVLLYQLLGGRLPYAQTDTVSFIGAIMRSDPPPLDQSVPESFRRVVMKALQRNPAQRYQSAAEMRHALRDAERKWWLSEGEQGKRSSQQANTVAAVPDPEATLVQRPAPDSTLVAQIPVVYDFKNQPPPPPTISFDPQIVKPAAPQFTSFVEPKKSRTKVWLSTLGFVLLLLIFLGARVLPRLLSSTSASSSETVSTSGPPTVAEPTIDIRRWLTMLAHSDQVEKVLQETNAVLETKPTNVLALRARAGAYYRSFVKDKGKLDVEEVDRLAGVPSTADEYEARCYARLRLNKLDEALDDCNHAIQLDSSTSPAWFTRGLIYSNKRDFDRSIADLSKAIEINPDDSFAYAYRGMAWEEKRNSRNGFADLTKALKLDPNSPIAYSGRANHYYYIKDYSRAVEDYTVAINLSLKESSFYVNRGNAYYSMQDYDRAAKDYTAATELDSGNTQAFQFRGNVFLIQQKYDAAIADYNKTIDLDPNNAHAFHDRGSAYYGKRDYERAIVDYNRSSELDAKDPTLYHDRGLALLAQQRYDLAIADFSYAITLNPRYALAYSRRADAYAGKGDYEAAAADREKAQELQQ